MILAISLWFVILFPQHSTTVTGYKAITSFVSMAKEETWLMNQEPNQSKPKIVAEEKKLIFNIAKQLDGCLDGSPQNIKNFSGQLVPLVMGSSGIPRIISEGKFETKNLDQKLKIIFYPKSASYPIRGLRIVYDPAQKSVLMPLVKIDPIWLCAMFAQQANYAKKDLNNALSKEFSPKSWSAPEAELRILELEILNARTGGKFRSMARQIANQKKIVSIDNLWDTLELADFMKLDSLFDRPGYSEAGHRVVTYAYAISLEYVTRKDVNNVANNGEIYLKLFNYIRN